MASTTASRSTSATETVSNKEEVACNHVNICYKNIQWSKKPIKKLKILYTLHIDSKLDLWFSLLPILELLYLGILLWNVIKELILIFQDFKEPPSVKPQVPMSTSYMLNDTLASLSGRIAANYLLRQQQQQNNFGNRIFHLPDNLKVAKKSLGSSMSEIYAMTLIVICVAFTSTEIIADQVALDYFESWGFYTYLYR